MDFFVDDEYNGRLLRDFLFKKLLLSRAIVADLKNCDGIAVNGLHATARYVLCAGDKVSLKLEDTYEDCDESLYPTHLPLDIIFEDEYIIAVNKPPYMPTHLSHGHRIDTLANLLKAEFDNRALPFVMRAVNRLDADTSGIVIIAKSRYAADRFAKPNLGYKKFYTAIVYGECEERGEIKTYIRRTADSVITRATFESGKESEFAHTKYEKLDSFGGISVVRCEPITGRTHQLRVHLASIGHPIVGDDLYGGGFELDRQALHAESLDFVHPFTKEEICLHAPMPCDMTNFLKEKKHES